jgi:hypothetical protein
LAAAGHRVPRLVGDAVDLQLLTYLDYQRIKQLLVVAPTSAAMKLSESGHSVGDNHPQLNSKFLYELIA